MKFSGALFNVSIMLREMAQLFNIGALSILQSMHNIYVLRNFMMSPIASKRLEELLNFYISFLMSDTEMRVVKNTDDLV